MALNSTAGRKQAPSIRATALAIASLVFSAALFSPQAVKAQRLVATVNNAPITDYDVRQRQRLLRALRQKSSPAAALESLVEQSVKNAEAKKYSIRPTDQQILAYAARDAQKRKIPQQRQVYALRRGGIDQIHWKAYYSSQLAWDTLIAALYKSVNVSAREVDAELAKRGDKSSKTEYLLRQVVFIVPRNAGGGVWNARMREARGLRARFRSCPEGAKLARGLRDVAVKKPITRRASQLNPQIVKLLDRTPVGKLTQPSRSINGIEMVAVCAKSDRRGRIAAGQTIRTELREKKLQVHSARRYRDLRSRALVIRR